MGLISRINSFFNRKHTADKSDKWTDEELEILLSRSGVKTVFNRISNVEYMEANREQTARVSCALDILLNKQDMVESDKNQVVNGMEQVNNL